MTRVVVAVSGPRGPALAARLERTGLDVRAVVSSAAPADSASDALRGAGAATVTTALWDADVLVLHATRSTLTAAVVAMCDRRGVRIAPLCDTPDDERAAAAFGLTVPLPLDTDGWELAEALREAPALFAPATPVPPTAGVIAVWGAAGAPGRSTLAIELAAELARGGGRVGLVDADAHAPSIALALGIPDEGPGFAAACRQAELGGLDAAELDRISIPVALHRGRVDVLGGINRPSRWPELSGPRVTEALGVCRTWVDHTVVDVSSSLERDEEIVSDLADGPRRNAATLAALRTADLVVAVVSVDPVGVARFLRAHGELRATVGATRVVVLANRLRPGALGVDARGQVRRALERFAGIRDVWFVPQDPRSADAALLAARPIAETSPRSPLALAMRRFVGEAVTPPAAAAAALRRSARPRRRLRARTP